MNAGGRAERRAGGKSSRGDAAEREGFSRKGRKGRKEEGGRMAEGEEE